MRNKSESRKKAEKLIENVLKQKEIKIEDWSQDSHDHWLGCFYILDVTEDIRIIVQKLPDGDYEITLSSPGKIVILTLFSLFDIHLGHDLKEETERMIKAIKELGLDFLLAGVEDE